MSDLIPKIEDIDVATLDRVIAVLDPLYPPAEVGLDIIEAHVTPEHALRKLAYVAGKRSIVDWLIAAKRSKERQ